MSKFSVPRMTLSRGVALCVGCTCIISLLAGAGWLFNRPVLASFTPNYIPMAPATALIFLGLCGAWLFRGFSRPDVGSEGWFKLLWWGCLSSLSSWRSDIYRTRTRP